MYLRRNGRLRIRRILAVILAAALLQTVLYAYIDHRLRTTARNFAMSHAKSVLYDCANTASARVLEETDLSYNDLAIISRDEQGMVTSIEINSVAVNLFKSYLSSAIAQELQKNQTVDFDLPVGTAFGYFYSRFNAAKLHYTMRLTTTAGSDFISKFTSAGINQVLHQIVVDIKLESELAMPHYDTKLSVSTSFIVAQTVVVGAVPDAFTNVSQADEKLVGEIFDYGAQMN